MRLMQLTVITLKHVEIVMLILKERKVYLN